MSGLLEEIINSQEAYNEYSTRASKYGPGSENSAFKDGWEQCERWLLAKLTALEIERSLPDPDESGSGS